MVALEKGRFQPRGSPPSQPVLVSSPGTRCGSFMAAVGHDRPPSARRAVRASAQVNAPREQLPCSIRSSATPHARRSAVRARARYLDLRDRGGVARALSPVWAAGRSSSALRAAGDAYPASPPLSVTLSLHLPCSTRAGPLASGIARGASAKASSSRRWPQRRPETS